MKFFYYVTNLKLNQKTARGTEIYFTDLTSDEDRRMQELIGKYDASREFLVDVTVRVTERDILLHERPYRVKIDSISCSTKLQRKRWTTEVIITCSTE